MNNIYSIQAEHGEHHIDLDKILFITSPFDKSPNYTVMFDGGIGVSVNSNKLPRNNIVAEWEAWNKYKKKILKVLEG